LITEKNYSTEVRRNFIKKLIIERHDLPQIINKIKISMLLPVLKNRVRIAIVVEGCMRISSIVAKLILIFFIALLLST